MTYDKESFLKGLMTGMRLGRGGIGRHSPTRYPVNKWIPATIYQDWRVGAAAEETNARMMLNLQYLWDIPPGYSFDASPKVWFFVFLRTEDLRNYIVMCSSDGSVFPYPEARYQYVFRVEPDPPGAQYNIPGGYAVYSNTMYAEVVRGTDNTPFAIPDGGTPFVGTWSDMEHYLMSL